MATIDLTKKRTIDFDPLKCGLKDDSVILFSPLDFIERNNLYLPEKVRMSDGSINENVVFDLWEFKRALELWEGGDISMYAGRNYIQTVLNQFGEQQMEHEQRIKYFHLSNVVNIFLYDNDIEVRLVNNSAVKCVRCTSNNGILYFGSDLYFVPDRNPYAESLPLTPVHGMYEDTYSSIDGIDLEGCGRDMFGGIYTLDGKSFVRWGGHDFVKSYKIRDGVEEIREKAFRLGYGSGLSIKNIHFPDTLKRIGREAFMSCRLITNITIPKNVIEIAEDAFYNCQSLESVTLSSNLRIIGKGAFGTTALKQIYIPENVVHIGDKCFDNCWQLSSIKVGEKNQNYSSEDGILYNFEKNVLLRIPPLLFPDSEQNTNLRKEKREKEIICGKDVIVEFINLFEGITFITKKDSKNGKEFKEIIKNNDGSLLPPQVLLLDNNKIVIREWELSEGCRIYVDDGDFVKSGKVIGIEWEYPMDYYGPSRKEYTIQESVKTLADGALQRSSLEKLIIPKNVEYIGKDQFQFCNISEIIVSPENEYYEFRDNSLIDKKSKKLLHWFGKEEDIVIPQGVEIVGEKAFEYINFKSLVIPEGVNCIENDAIWCSEYGFSIYLPSSLCHVASNAFYGLKGMRYSDCEYNIYVPHGLSPKYVKLLDCYERDLKEIYSGSIEEQFSENNYKALAVWNDEIQKQAVGDDYSVYYSKDGKILISQDGFDIPSYHVKEGTEIICEGAALSATTIHLPSSVKYVGEWGIFTQSLVLEGTNILFAPNWWGLDKDNSFYIPCGSWAKYRALLEKAKSHDEGDEEKNNGEKEYDDYKLIELSRASVLAHLRSQLSVFKSVIEQQKLLCSFESHSLNGTNENEMYCFRTKDQTLVFTCNLRCFIRYAAYLSILGYSLKDITDFLEFQIETIEVRDDTIESAVYKTIAFPVKKEWTEDFVDEETGEVEKEEFSEIVFPVGHWIYGDDIEVLKESGVKNISVIDQSHSDYASIAYFFMEPGTDDWQFLYPELYEQDRNAAFNAVLMEMFPFKRPEEITEDDKRILAHNILTVIKGITEHSSNVLDLILPFKYSGSDIHKEMSNEEQNVYRLINEFYNEMIEKVTACNTDLEVMKVFKDKSEILFELQSYLKDNGVSSQIIRAFVDNIFLYLK